MCYEIESERFIEIAGVSLNDEFGSGTVELRRAKRLCNPADKNDEDPTAPSDPDHLSGYVIKQTAPQFIPVPALQVTNQFGSITVDVVRPDMILVPSAKSLSAPPPPLTNPAIDHFKCYKIKGARFRVPGITVDDQFGTLRVDLKKPIRLCAAADKNGEGIQDPTAHLLCYKARISSGFPRFRGPGVPVYIDNQFGPDTIDVRHERELCVPSTVNP